MTREEIMNMPAGRKMDKLIAKNVTKLKANGTFGGYAVYNDPHNKYQIIYLPYYSTDISKAWEVVESANIQMLNNVHGVWECYSGNNIGKSNSAPLAICRAALLAVIGDK